MIRRLPILPTLIVLTAVAVMIGLGFWQIRRAQEKETDLARYGAASTQPPIAFPSEPSEDVSLPLFRRSTAVCPKVVRMRTTAGRNRREEPGFIFIADCTGAAGRGVSVELGWTKNPDAKPQWSGGPVTGVIAPDSRSQMRLVSDTGLGGLEPSMEPSVQSIPNNHRSYAIQWFLFAISALVIYGLAVRKRITTSGRQS